MAGSVALLVAFLGLFFATKSPLFGYAKSMDFGYLTQLASTGELERLVTGPVMLWLAIGVLAGFAVKVPMIPFHTWLPAAYAEAPSPVTMLLTGAMSKMGVYGLLRIALPFVRPPDRADAHAAAGACRGYGGDGRLGGGGAEGFEAHLRLHVGESPGLLSAGHLRAGGSGGWRWN